MRIGILGSGLMGGTLGTIFARAGHEVVFSYARSDDKLRRLAREAGATARSGFPAEAAEGADALLLAVHWNRVDDVLQQVGTVKGRLIITCSLPMNDDDSELVVGRTSSGAERLARKARGARVVSAFGTVPSEVLLPVFERRNAAARPDMLYCGDDAEARSVASVLIQDAGFEPADAGPLRMARYLEPFTLVVARLAYQTGEAPEVAYRFLRLHRQA